MPARPTVVVAALTYQRPDDLPELLPALRAQIADVEHEVSILIVDNDAAASAREVVEGLAMPEVRYVVEPTPGIAAARNRALDEASEDLLIFIDDDERPEPDWLRELLACHEREQCAAVAGAVVPDVGLVEDPWIDAGGFFVRKRHATGSEVDAASTANLLLDLRVLRGSGLRFDERFGLSGGSDTMFTRELTRAGHRIVWCDEATVIDHIRVQRLNRTWVLQRHYRAGNSWSRTTLALEKAGPRRLLTRSRLTGIGTARIVVGSLRTLAGRLTRNLRHQARGSRTTARGTGMVVGAWGGVYTEYRRPQAAHSSA